ncbi:MAG: FAD-dependent oxidoreductase [Firmicutes bacterium]|nr:FAD-dependent oxidoreductase [Bacillota bacterium]
MKSEARVVVIGGGVAGTSIAYHLTQLGWHDVVLLDRNELTSGSTFHSAGLVGQLRSSVTLTKMLMYSAELYRRLHQETGVDPGWHEVGSLRLASTPERMEELKRQAGWAKTFGLPLELISPEEARRLFPLMDLSGVYGAAYLPTDGYLDPSKLAEAFAKGARQGGCEIYTHTRVVALEQERGRIRRVVTDRGTITAEVVVNAGGMYANEIGRLAGVVIPIIPMQHQYIITTALEAVDPAVIERLPTMRDPDNLVYFRAWGHGLVIGGYERTPAPWGLDVIPPTFNGQLLSPDWDRFAPIMEGAMRRVPVMEEATIQSFINGPEAFTPDGEFIMGETDVRGFYVAAGFCAHGIAGAGGVGRMMAEWIVHGEPSLDLWKMDIRRFGPHYRSQALARARTLEVYATYYDIRYPHEEYRSARPLRVSPAYESLKALGASFGEKANWERVNWFETNAAAGDPTERPEGWAGQVWSPAIGVEHRAARTAVALFDETSFSKFEVSGPGAVRFLQTLCDNDIDKPVGTIVYTQMLNQRGGIECDLTVTRLRDDAFRLITGTAFGYHDMGWVRQHMPDDGSVQLHDVTSQYACFALWGPRAREVLQQLVRDDLSAQHFPFMSGRELTVADVPVFAARVTFVGELGWELYCPSEFGQRLWQVLVEAGQPYGLVPGGYRAIDSLRLEKGYRVWGADVTPETTPYEAGLGFCVKLDKGVPFIGEPALREQKQRGISQRLRCLVLADPHQVAEGGEPVRHEGTIIGRVTSGGYGYTVRQSLAYAYLPKEFAIGSPVEVEVMGSWVRAVVTQEPVVPRVAELTS